MRRQAPLRLFRSLLVTGTVFSLAAGAHLLGGGTLPGGGVVLALAAFVLLPVTLLASRRLTFSVLLGVLGGGQFMLHEAFALFAGGPGAARMAGHLHSAPELDWSAGTPRDPGSLPMFGAHAAAVLATAWVLAQGEAAFWRLLSWLRPLLRRPRPFGMQPRRPLPAVHDALRVPPPRRNLRSDSRRGPPAVPPAYCPAGAGMGGSVRSSHPAPQRRPRKASP